MPIPGSKTLRMEACEGTCGLVLAVRTLYVCDCPKKESLCLPCLKAHAAQLHTNYYHIPRGLKGAR